MYQDDHNSIVKFSVPVGKSTTIAITKNDENKIISRKNYYQTL